MLCQGVVRDGGGGSDGGGYDGGDDVKFTLVGVMRPYCGKEE